MYVGSKCIPGIGGPNSETFANVLHGLPLRQLALIQISILTQIRAGLMELLNIVGDRPGVISARG